MGQECQCLWEKVVVFVISVWAFRSQRRCQSVMCFSSPSMTPRPWLTRSHLASITVAASGKCFLFLKIRKQVMSSWDHLTLISPRDGAVDWNAPLLVRACKMGELREVWPAQQGFRLPGFIIMSRVCGKRNVKCKYVFTVALLASTLSNIERDFMWPVTGSKYKLCTKMFT